MIPIRDTSVSRGFAPATALIILINFGMFLEEIHIGEQIFQLFSVSPHDIYRYLTKGTGNILSIHWSILVSGFMHSGYIHLFGNMIFLSVFGPAVEKNIGIMRYILLYLCAVFVSFYVHTIFYPTSSIQVVGASGAIAAIMGSYLILNPKAKILTIIPLLFFIEIIEIPSVVFILVWFTLQGANGYLSINSHTSVAWFSHIGGFLMGVAFGMRLRWFR
ncbi:MAG: rhomboid family intramembrane serine protease [Deltaproteobacteria bacterium]|nr:rhomboid family intramembrane serine protease [Deltaproteobacteria bacterium]